VTALDECCLPVTNACGTVVTDGFISVVLTQEISAADVITVKKASGAVCINDLGCDTLLDLQAVISLCMVNPELIGLTTGQEVVLDYAGNAVGMRRSSDLNCDNRFALEVWTNIAGTGVCVGSPPIKNYGYFLVPCLRNATITGDVTIDGTNAVSVELTAKTSVPSLWGTGPQTAAGQYKVVATDGLNTPGYLLTPIGATDHDQMITTTIAPPVPPDDCGCTSLTIEGSSVVPVVSVLAPNTAFPAAGGKNFELIGAHLTGATAVSVGGTPATGIVVVDDGHLVATSPAKAAGSYTVTVTTPSGTSPAFSGLTYV
jgi:hypothetical protein